MIKPEKLFCDVEYRTLDNLKDVDVAIFGACHGTPYKPGKASHAANAPAAIRKALSWYSSNPEQLDLDIMKPVFGGKTVVDCGDINGCTMNGAANRETISQTTRDILLAGTIPILIGGDDSTPIPFIEAISSQIPVVIVQIDAHIDWREEIDGERFGFSSTMRRSSEFENIQEIIQIGGRGPGSARLEDLKAAEAWGVKFFFARHVHNDGLGSVIEAIPRNSNIILAIDVDGLDPSVVPGVILPAFGGLRFEHVTEIILSIMERANIVGADFVELVPERDAASLGAMAVARLICTTIASTGSLP